MELVLVRHAHPENPAPPESRSDPGLSETGRMQAAAVARRLESSEWAALYTSPQRRAVETAAVVADRLGLRPVTRPGLAEFDEGRPYLHLEDLLAGGNDIMAAFRREDFSAYGTDAATIRRKAVDAIEAIIAAHPGQQVVVVTHGTVINAFTGAFLGSPRLVFHHPTYTGVTRVLAGRTGKREIACLNDSTHLRLPWRTSTTEELR